MPLGFNVSVPLVGELTPIAVNEVPSASVSFARSVEDPVVVSVTVPPSSKEIVSLTVSGASLTGFMTIVMVAVSPYNSPSKTLYKNVSVVVSEPSCT